METGYNLLLRNTKLGTEDLLQDIWIQKDSIVRITPTEELEYKPARSLGAIVHLVSPVLFDTHILLDKACILDRCTIEEGNFNEVIEQTGEARKSFIVEDACNRSSRILEMATENIFFWVCISILAKVHRRIYSCWKPVLLLIRKEILTSPLEA